MMKSVSITKAQATVPAVALITMGLIFTACGGQESAPPSASETPAMAQEKSGEPLETLRIRAADDQVAVTFKWSSEEIRIHFDEGEEKRYVRSRFGGGRNRRYNERSAGTVALVRSNPDSDAFTIRTPKGDLEWRVRLGKKVVLVGDHPDKPGFEIRRPKSNVFRAVAADQTVLGEAVFNLRDSRVRVLDGGGTVLYKGKASQASALYAALAVPELDTVTRYILMAELLHRQR